MNGPITWFIKNPIAGNLLMVLLIIGGFASIPKLDKQFFPTPEINQIQIRMEFRGASPSEVEEQISVRIEEAIHDLNGIEELRSTSREGLALVMVEVESDYPTQKLTNDINTRVDAIRTFPSDAERPTVTELTYRHQMGRVQIYGDLSEREMKQLGETLRDELVRQPWVSIVELQTARPYEVSIEVSERSLVGDASFRLRCIHLAATVLENGPVLQGGKTMAKTGRNQQTAFVRGAQKGAVGFPVGRRTGAKVHDHVVDGTLYHTDQLGLCVRRALEMEPAQDAAVAHAFVVLLPQELGRV